MMELDRTCYKIEHRSNEKITIDRLNINPHTDLVIMDGHSMVGYISLLPIRKALFNKIRYGMFEELEIEKNVLPFFKRDTYFAYLSSVVVNKQKYPHFPGKYLFIQLREHLLQLRKRGIFVKKIIALAVSLGGRRILSKMGFKEEKANIFLCSCYKQGMQFVKERHLLNPHCYAFNILTVKDVDV